MQWYIINDQNQVGPFSKDDLKACFENNNLPNSTLIKSERMKRPMTFSSIFPVSSKSVAVELPNIPTFNEVPELTKESIHQDTLHTDDLIFETSESEAETESTSDINEQIITEVESITKKRKYPVKLYIIIFLLLGSIVSAYVYLKLYTPVFVRPKNMSLETFKKIKNIHKSDYLMAKVYLSKDKKTIWFATNNFATGKVRISLDSIKGKILSKNKVLLTSDATLKDGIATFNKFVYESNESLIDGEYMMNLENISTLSVPLIYKLKKNELNLNYRKKMLLTNSTKAVFNNKLNKFLKKLKRNKNEFLNELIQKYLTLKTMVEQIKDRFSTTFSNTALEWNNRAEMFEDLYTKQFGPFFTSFVIANEKQYELINKKEFPNKTQIISDYTRLSRIAKEVGLMSVGVMEEYEKFDFSKSSVDETLNFKESILNKFDKVIEECSNKLQSLQRENL